VTYGLVYTRRAVKDIEKLDRNVRQRIGKTLLRYANDPVEYAEKLTDTASDARWFSQVFRSKARMLGNPG
jgi:mRNA-degrading endonuclease RelE of RelBE toxin-antitoxin system